MKFPLAILLATFLTLVGCDRPTPHTIETTSAAIPTLAARIHLLNQYVEFRRSYDTLDFAIRYKNGNDSSMPSPSEWDIRIATTVPEAELDLWSLAGPPLAAPNRDWLKQIPTALDLSGVSEWSADKGREVGIDRARRIVVYRNLRS